MAGKRGRQQLPKQAKQKQPTSRRANEQQRSLRRPETHSAGARYGADVVFDGLEFALCCCQRRVQPLQRGVTSGCTRHIGSDEKCLRSYGNHRGLLADVQLRRLRVQFLDDRCVPFVWRIACNMLCFCDSPSWTCDSSAISLANADCRGPVRRA